MLSQRTALLQRVHLVPRQQQQQHICCASVQQQQTAQQQPNSATPVLSDDEEDDQQALNPQQQAALAALQAVFTPLEVDKLLSSSKRSVLDLPTGDWIEFMQVQSRAGWLAGTCGCDSVTACECVTSLSVCLTPTHSTSTH